jgi:hypothetical protein
MPNSRPVSPRNRIDRAARASAGANPLLLAAFHALRSYQYGNASLELAEETATAIEAWLAVEGIDKWGAQKMPLDALKSSWTMTAGIIPGTAMKEHTRRWMYTGADFAIDRANANDGKSSNIFTAMRKDAHDYSLRLCNPLGIKWARLNFRWY